MALAKLREVVLVLAARFASSAAFFCSSAAILCFS
jgi:hypothetical protein